MDLTPEEFQQGVRMLYANGPLPGLPKGGKPRFILASANAFEMQRAVGYLEHCQRLTGKRIDCWDDLNASGGLDDVEGARSIALGADGSVAIDLGAGTAMAAVNANARPPSPNPSPARFDPTRDQHIFRKAPGHVNPSSHEDKARYIRLFERVASDPANRRLDAVQAGIMPPAAADAGVQAFTFVDELGQVWVTVRNGLIENAGVNPLGAFR